MLTAFERLPPGRQRTAIWFACGLVALLFFWLPYYVPVSYAVDSLSVRVGFNNAAAAAILLAGLAGISVLRLVLGRTVAPTAESGNFQPMDRRVLILGLALVTFRVLVLAWVQDSPGTLYEERYFLSKLLHLHAGHLPYRDFEFAYGPGMLLLPYWIQRFSGLTDHFAYSAAVWLFNVVGGLLLWAILQVSRCSRRYRTVLFVVLFGGFALGVLDLALQYTLLRFIFGFGALLAVDVLSNRISRWWPLLSAAGTFFTIAIFMFSPEIGLAFAVSLLAYFAAEALRGSNKLLLATAGYVLATGLAVWLSPAGLFESTRNFSLGGNAFPVLPSPYMLFYVGSLLGIIPLVAASVLSSIRSGWTPSLPFGVSLSGAFAVNSVAMMPGAVGTADGGHVACYGFGVFLLALLGVGLTGSWRTAYAGLFAAMLLLLNFKNVESNFAVFRSLAAQRALEWVQRHHDTAAFLRERVGPERWSSLQTRFEVARRRSLEGSYPALSQYQNLCVPLLVPGDAFLTAARHGNLHLEYYFADQGVYTAAQVRRKVEGLRACEFVITDMPWTASAGEPVGTPDPGEDMLVMRTLLMCPFPPAIRSPRRPDPLAQAVAAEYEPIENLKSGLTLSRRRTR